MININKETDMSVTITNNFEEIKSKIAFICEKLNTDLFNSELYSDTVTDILKTKKELESITLLNKELFKQCAISAINTCGMFLKECDNIITERDKKDIVNNGRNVNASSMLLDVNKYYSILIDESSNHDPLNPKLINIETNKSAEIGSIDIFLHTYLPVMCSDIKYISQFISITLDRFLQASDECMKKINNITETVTSPRTIETLNTQENVDESISMIMGSIAPLCEDIAMYAKMFKYIILKYMALLTVIQTNFITQQKALSQYVVTESLL